MRNKHISCDCNECLHQRIRDLEKTVSDLAISERKQMLLVDELEKRNKILREYYYHFDVRIEPNTQQHCVTVVARGITGALNSEVIQSKKEISIDSIKRCNFDILNLEKINAVTDIIQMLVR